MFRRQFRQMLTMVEKVQSEHACRRLCIEPNTSVIFLVTMAKASNRKKGLFQLIVLGDTIHHSAESMAVGVGGCLVILYQYRKAGRNECQDLANFFFFMEMVPASQPQLTQSSLTTCPELYLQGGSRFRQVNHQMITPTLCVFLLSFCLYYLSCLSPYYFTCLYVFFSPVSPFPFLVILYLSYLFLFLCVSPCLSHTKNQRQTIVFNAINIKTLDPKAVLVFQYQQKVFSCLYNSPVRGQLPTRQNLLYHESLALPLPPVPLLGTYRFTHSPPHSRRLSTHQILSQDEFWLSCH